MTYDELELEAYVSETLEEYNRAFETMDDDYEEAYEYVNQFSPINKKRITELDIQK